MKKIIGLLTLVIICSCSLPKQKSDVVQQKDETSSKYPFLVDSMGLQEKYDRAKWSLYCIYCDDTVKLKKPKDSNGRTFGSLELRCTGLERKNDSLEFKFYFYSDSTRCDLGSVENFGNKFFANGVLFIKDSLAFYTTPTTARYFWQGGNRNRFFNILQPEVITYIRSNKNKLDPWFRDEAIKRKIIE